MRQLAFALSLALAGCSRPTLTGVQIDPALSILIPGDTILTVAANIETLKKTAVYQKHLASRGLPQLDELARLTGIDARKDLWQVVFVADRKHAVMLGRGNFPAEIETKLQRDGAKVTGHKMYHLVGSDEASVVFFNTSTAAVGSVESLKALVDGRGSSNGPPAGIAAGMKEIPAEAQLWAVYIGGARKLPVELQGNWANLYKLLGSVGTASVYFDLRDGLKSIAKATTPSQGEAKQLSEAVRGLVGFGRLSAPANQPELLRAFDGIQVTENGTTATLKIEESPELVEKLLNLVGVH